jgi:hypothetical protein
MRCHTLRIDLRPAAGLPSASIFDDLAAVTGIAVGYLLGFESAGVHDPGPRCAVTKRVDSEP